MGKLDGMVVWVTGAGRKRGIGRAIALRLAQDGADVLVSAIRRDPSLFPAHEQAEGWRGAESLAEEIRAMGRQALALDCDITNTDEINACVAEGQRVLGPLTGLVNNAAVAGEAAAASIVDMPDELWFSTIDINLNGVYRTTKAAGRAMLAHGKPSCIVNISALSGRFGFANFGGYCASKFAVIGLTQQLALELAPAGIRVNCVCPGSVDTDMLEGTMKRRANKAGISLEELKANYTAAAIPMGRRGQTSEQAAVVAFLMSPDASYITGQSLNVDGGYRMD